MRGLVTKNTGSGYWVRLDNGKTLLCKVKGNFRLKGIRTTNPVAVGDFVEVDEVGNDVAYITKIEERENYIKEDSLIKIEKVIEFAKHYEDNHLNTLVYINKLWLQYFKEVR